jgi:hypothetical protein
MAWYAKLLGREPDTRPMNGLAEWQFETGGWLQVFEDKKRAGHSSVTLVETDVVHRIAELKSKGIALFSETLSESIKLAIVKDPDGNQVVFAQGQDEDHRAVA